MLQPPLPVKVTSLKSEPAAVIISPESGESNTTCPPLATNEPEVVMREPETVVVPVGRVSDPLDNLMSPPTVRSASLDT